MKTILQVRDFKPAEGDIIDFGLWPAGDCKYKKLCCDQRGTWFGWIHMKQRF